MPNILHRIGAKAPIESVCQAVATPEGISAWWSEQTTGGTRTGDRLSSTFIDPDTGEHLGTIEYVLEQLEPGKRVGWRTISGPEERVGMKNLDSAELRTIERELFIDASPETVFDVVSQPEHVAQWWPDLASYDVEVGASGEIAFGAPADGGRVFNLTVMDVDPPRTFSFRWTHEAGQEAVLGNSLFVTFALLPSGGGTLLRLSETGFREMGWDAATLETHFDEHVDGWNTFLARLAPYAERVVSSR